MTLLSRFPWEFWCCETSRENNFTSASLLKFKLTDLSGKLLDLKLCTHIKNNCWLHDHIPAFLHTPPHSSSVEFELTALSGKLLDLCTYIENNCWLYDRMAASLLCVYGPSLLCLFCYFSGTTHKSHGNGKMLYTCCSSTSKSWWLLAKTHVCIFNKGTSTSFCYQKKIFSESYTYSI